MLQADPAGCFTGQHHLHCFFAGCATTVLVTGAGIGEMVLQLLVGSVSVGKACQKSDQDFEVGTFILVLDSCWEKSTALPLSYHSAKLVLNAD